MLTYAPCRLMHHTKKTCWYNFGCPFSRPYPCTKVPQIRQSKPTLSDLKSHIVQKRSGAPNTIDLTANPGAPPKIHFIRHNNLDKSHLFWSIGLRKPDYHEKEFQRVVKCVLSKYQKSLLNLPKTCIAKSMPYKKQPTAISKQSGY